MEMDRPLRHEEIQELLGAYALDAVDPDEADIIELHLRDCPRCRAEVAGHREAAAMLAHVGATAPPGVWDRIAESLEGQAPDFDGAAYGPPEPAGVTGIGTGKGRRPRPGRGITSFTAAAVAVAAMVIVALGLQVSRLDHRLTNLGRDVRGDGVQGAALTALTDPAGRVVHLRSPDGVRTADAVVLPDGSAYLVVHQLPSLAADQTYQLWAIVGDRKVSVGVLGREPSVAAFHVDANPALLAVTAEQAGGVTSTDKTPVIVGAVPVRSA